MKNLYRITLEEGYRMAHAFYRSLGLTFILSFKNLFLITGFKTLSFLGGLFSKYRFGLDGLFSNPPPQFGQTFFNIVSTQSLQNVQSNVHIIASLLSLGNTLSQFSQLSLISIVS